MKVIIFAVAVFRSTNRENFSPTPTSSSVFHVMESLPRSPHLEPPSAVGMFDVTVTRSKNKSSVLTGSLIVGILFCPRKKENLSTANSDASENQFLPTKSQLSFYLFQPILFFPLR